MTKIRRAATVMLLRDIAGEPELYLLRRASRSEFAPDAFVFPGGAVDLSDTLPALHARINGSDASQTAALFREQRDAALPTLVEHPGPLDRASILAAALRELFEEAGILLTVQPEENAAAPTAVQRDAWRADLRAGRASFLDILEANDLIANG